MRHIPHTLEAGIFPSVVIEYTRYVSLVQRLIDNCDYETSQQLISIVRLEGDYLIIDVAPLITYSVTSYDTWKTTGNPSE